MNVEDRRCSWGNSDALYRAYHDFEWGVPVHDDIKLFEFLILESFQSGLSWLTILRKRENFRKAFDGFIPERVASFSEDDINRLMTDPGIIRNRRKIEAAVNNAKCFLEIRKEFGSFNRYIWGFTNNRTLVNHWDNNAEIPATTKLSDTIAADLKKRGFKFIGSTVIYSHMQATGMVNDHLVYCFRHSQVSGK